MVESRMWINIKHDLDLRDKFTGLECYTLSSYVKHMWQVILKCVHTWESCSPDTWMDGVILLWKVSYKHVDLLDDINSRSGVWESDKKKDGRNLLLTMHTYRS